MGTVTQPITFTSATNTGSREWPGILFDGGTGHLRHVTVRYGGGWDGYAYSNVTVRNVLTDEVRVESSRVMYEYSEYGFTDYGLYIAGSRAVVSDTLFANNGTNDYALYATGASTLITVTESTIRNNAGQGIGMAGGARATVRHSTVRDNGVYEVYNTSATPPDARYNWWGQAPPSTGFFYGTVLYTPWIVTSTFASGYFDLANDIYEPNDAFAQATPLSGVNTTLAAFLDPAGDADLYRLDVAEGSNLLAIADATGTPLALQVSLYDVNENLLATATGAAGAAVTATTPITPGLYFVRVTGTGNAQTGSSHLPYRLTLLQVDARTNLVAQTVGEAGRTYDFGAFAINLVPGASTELQATAPPSLTVEGGYYTLHG